MRSSPCTNRSHAASTVSLPRFAGTGSSRCTSLMVQNRPWFIPDARRRARGPRRSPLVAAGPAADRALRRASSCFVTRSRLCHRPALPTLGTVVGLRTSLSGPRVRNVASRPVSGSAPAGRVRGSQQSVHPVDRYPEQRLRPAGRARSLPMSASGGLRCALSSRRTVSRSASGERLVGDGRAPSLTLTLSWSPSASRRGQPASDCSGACTTGCSMPTTSCAAVGGQPAPIACKKPGPTSAQPIRRSGPTASNAAFPYLPTTRGSATFNADVTTLAKISNRRPERSTSGEAPVSVSSSRSSLFLLVRGGFVSVLGCGGPLGFPCRTMDGPMSGRRNRRSCWCGSVTASGGWIRDGGCGPTCTACSDRWAGRTAGSRPSTPVTAPLRGRGTC